MRKRTTITEGTRFMEKRLVLFSVLPSHDSGMSRSRGQQQAVLTLTYAAPMLVLVEVVDEEAAVPSWLATMSMLSK